MTARFRKQDFKPCNCELHKYRAPIKLSENILDIWMREYHKKPYNYLLLHKRIFEKRLYDEFGEEDMKVLVDFLKKRKNITHLELLYINLFLTEDVLEKFAFSLKNVTIVCLINVDVPEKLLKLFRESYDSFAIKLLRLTGNHLSQRCVEHLSDFVKCSKCLEYLDIGFCGLDEGRLAHVADGVHKSESLKGINLSRLELQSPVSVIDESHIAIIISTLIWKTPLIEVHFKGCFLDSHSMEPIAEYLSLNSNLLYLDLGSNRIGADGVLMLLKAISFNKKLVGLDLSNNKFGSHGGEVLAHWLPDTGIRFLDIARNDIGSSGINLILNTIKKTTQIRILNICGNNFDYISAELLNRQICANILLLDTLDVDVTFDDDSDQFRVVPQSNKANSYNERYHRIANNYLWPNCFLKQWEDFKMTLSYNKHFRTVLVNSMFVGPILINKFGEVVSTENTSLTGLNNICIN